MSLDWRPDTPFSPSILSSATFLLPDKSGAYRTPYSATALSGWNGSFGTTPLSARMVQDSQGNPSTFIGSATALYEQYAAGGPTTATRTVGGAYSASSTSRWWFCPYGDIVVASNLNDTTQSRTISAPLTFFADMSGPPKAKFFLSQQGYLLACSYNDGTAVLHGVKWATQGSSTNFTPANGNTAGNAILRESPGAIIAGAELHDIVVLWKKNSMYVGRVIGGAGTSVWQFDMISPKIGCASLDAWVTTPVGIIFVSPNNGVYKFDGSVPVPIDRGFRQELKRNLGTASQVKMSHDEASQCVYIWASSGLYCAAYNYGLDKWGHPYQGPALGNANFTTFQCAVRDANFEDYTTLGASDTGGNSRCHLIISSEKTFCNLSTHAAGTGINAAYSLLNVRDPKAGPDDLTQLTRVVPVHAFNSESGFYDGEPSSGTMTISTKPRPGAASTSSTSVSLDSNRRYDCNVVGNALDLSFAHTAQTMILSDLLFNTQKVGTA